MKNLRACPLTASGLLALAALAGCASGGQGSKASIAVHSDPPGAVARLGNQEITTPGTLEMPAKGPVTVRFEMEGCRPIEIVLRRERRARAGSGPAAPGDDGQKPGSWTASTGPDHQFGILVPFEALARWFRGASENVGQDPWPLAVRARLECGPAQPATDAAVPGAAPPAGAAASGRSKNDPRWPSNEPLAGGTGPEGSGGST